MSGTELIAIGDFLKVPSDLVGVLTSTHAGMPNFAVPVAAPQRYTPASFDFSRTATTSPAFTRWEAMFTFDHSP